MKSENKPSLRTARLFGIMFLAYSIVMPFIILLIPESDLPVGSGFSDVISWLMVFLMPVELLLLYVSYRHFSKKSELDNIVGPAILMYMFAVIPSVYAFIIGFIGSSLRSFAIPLGLAISLIGFGLAWMFISNLWENFTASEGY